MSLSLGLLQGRRCLCRLCVWSSDWIEVGLKQYIAGCHLDGHGSIRGSPHEKQSHAPAHHRHGGTAALPGSQPPISCDDALAGARSWRAAVAPDPGGAAAPELRWPAAAPELRRVRWHRSCDCVRGRCTGHSSSHMLAWCPRACCSRLGLHPSSVPILPDSYRSRSLGVCKLSYDLHFCRLARYFPILSLLSVEFLIS
jgi:hypothetical protein